MRYTTFTAEQLAQVARADMQQSELLRYWLLIARDRTCHNSIGRVFTSGRASCRAFRDCGARLETSLDDGSIQRRPCAGSRCPAPGCAI
jgi:hypothetical protein